jgi:secernin
MCDTVIATPEVTADGVMLFGKNSDRDPNEAHQILYAPALDHGPGESVSCTYISVPQVAHTHAVLLSKPFWIWGAEMGVNEHGVTIGNEAIFSKIPAPREKALLGMDLLRLGLERASTAEEAVDIMTSLLETHGQGGACGFQHEAYYHNSFLLADPSQAWVLEMVGRRWAARRVSGVYTISNALTIGSTFDKASPDLVDHALEKGWCKNREDFDFSRCYSDFLYTTFSDARKRCGRTAMLLDNARGEITGEMLMSILRDHGVEGNNAWRPDQGVLGAEVCMHASFGPVRFSQTTGSMVSHLHPDHPTHFLTGTAAPCTSIFKPFWLDAPQVELGPEPSGKYDPQTLFWRHERLHRAVLEDYPTRVAAYEELRDKMERGFVIEALECAQESLQEREAFSRDCFQRAWQAEGEWFQQVKDLPIQGRRGWLHSLAWDKFNREAEMPLDGQG